MESVRWNQHSAHLTHSVSELYKNLELTDCILDVEGKSISVHKTILAACSPYFKEILKKDNAMKLISIKDVSYKDMKVILDFIYFGEADVCITDVTSVMKTAELLEMTSLNHNVCHSFQKEFPSKDTSERSMDDKCSVPCTNQIGLETRYLMEEQVPYNRAILYMGEERLSFKSQRIHGDAAGDFSASNLSNIQDESEKSNEDQLKSSVFNTYDTFRKNTDREKGNVLEELVPFTYVAISEIKEANESHQDDSTCFDSDLKDPLGYYSGALNVTEERSVKEEFTLESELLVKKEPKYENDVPESIAEGILIRDNWKHSFHKWTSTKCNPLESCNEASGTDKNLLATLNDTCGFEDCDSEENHDFEIEFESICEISGADVKEKKVFETGQGLNHIVGDTTKTALLEAKNELLNFSNSGSQQNVNEEDFDASSTAVSNSFALEIGNKTPALYKTRASSSAETVFGEERKNLKKKMKESDSSSHNCEGVHSTEVIKFSCNICCKSFRNVCHLRSHMLTHTRKKEFHYKINQNLFYRKGHLSRHVRTHFGTERLDRPVCNKPIVNKLYLRKHMRTHRRQELSACEICKKTFSLKRSLDLHMRTHTGDRPFDCVLCKKSFSFKAVLNRHMLTHNGYRPFECEICRKTFSLKGNLKRHISVHTGDRPFECELCRKTFSRKEDLNRHMRFHKGDRPFECEICKKSFHLKGDLNRHMLIHNGDRPFQCELCKKSFYSKGYLNRHMHTHKGDRPFKCEICKKSFYLKGDLNRHMLIHNGVRPFECELCKKSFSLIGRLNQHILTHNGDRPFECEVCRKTFSRKGNLNIHMLFHKGDRPFECEICKKSFYMKGDLNRHMLIHNGDRPFECELCKKSFYLKRDLNQHIHTHKGDRPFECEICKKSFSLKGYLYRHMLTHNRDRPFEYE